MTAKPPPPLSFGALILFWSVIISKMAERSVDPGTIECSLRPIACANVDVLGDWKIVAFNCNFNDCFMYSRRLLAIDPFFSR